VSQPDVGDVHVNSLLSNVSIGYSNSEDAFIADRVFPLIYAQKQSDLYVVYNRGDFFRDEGDRMLRAPGAPTVITGYGMSNNPYYAKNYAIGGEIPVELRANADNVFDVDRSVVQLVTNLQQIRRERAFAADFMTTNVWGTDVTGDVTAGYTKWSDYGASNPLLNIRTAIRTVQSATGMKPNKLVLGGIVWDALVDHPDLMGRISGGATNTTAAIARPSLLAELLGLDEILIADGIYNSAAEGAAVSMARIIDDDALLLYTPRTPSLMMPSAGYTFVWQSAVLGPAAPQFIRRWEDQERRRTVIESHSYWDQVVTESLAGFFFSDITD
jgi:hypothetical protein